MKGWQCVCWTFTKESNWYICIGSSSRNSILYIIPVDVIIILLYTFIYFNLLLGWSLVHTYRLEELGIDVSQPGGVNQVIISLSNESFPWNETRITALSNLYMNSRTLHTTEYQCDINQVGVYVLFCNYANIDWACTYVHNVLHSVLYILSLTASDKICSKWLHNIYGMNYWQTDIIFISLTLRQDIVWTPDEAIIEGCELVGAAVLERSSGMFLMMTALAAFLLVA